MMTKNKKGGRGHSGTRESRGTGQLIQLLSVNQSSCPLIVQKWEISPIGNARLFGNTLERSANE